MSLDHPVVSSLLPVVLLISTGWLTARAGLVRAGSVRDLSNLVFLVLAQALLFRTMSQVQVQTLDFAPVAQYFLVAVALFVAVFWWHGRDSRAAVLGLAGIFSNTLMIGVPLVGLAYGQAGLVLLFTLISLHALILLTAATVVLELQVAREQAVAGGRRPPLWRSVARAMRNAIIHPVPMPILLGLAWAQTGWSLPGVVDRPLALLGAAFGPVALVLVGITLAQTALGERLREALWLSVVKNLVHPLLMAAVGWALGLRGLHLSVMVVVAALPIGANVFLFSQRYQRAQETVTAGVALSTVVALGSVTLAMALLPLLPAA